MQRYVECLSEDEKNRIGKITESAESVEELYRESDEDFLHRLYEPKYFEFCLKNTISIEDAERSGLSTDKIKENWLQKKMPGFIVSFPITGIDIQELQGVKYLPDSQGYYSIPAIYEERIKIFKESGVELVVDIPSFGLNYCYSEKLLQLNFSEYGRIKITRNGEVFKSNKIRQVTVVIYFDGGMYEIIQKVNKDKICAPITLRTICKIAGSSNYNPFYLLFLSAIEMWAKEKHQNYLFSDLRPYLDKAYFLPPVTVNEVLEHKSCQHLFRTKYHLKKNWNKGNVNLLYLIEKVSERVNAQSQKMLLNFNDKDFLVRSGISIQDRFRMTSSSVGDSRDAISKFIKQWYLERFAKNECEYDTTIISDYINMCFITKTKVNLCFHSYKKLKDIHDKLARMGYKSKTGSVKVPVNSKFNELRQLLPEEFEWIRTRSRLIKETEIQNHCVWSYAGKISKDMCAIYSLLFEPEQKRYTIEFGFKNGKYVIVQIQSAYNCEKSAKVLKYIKGFLVAG